MRERRGREREREKDEERERFVHFYLAFITLHW